MSGKSKRRNHKRKVKLAIEAIEELKRWQVVVGRPISMQQARQAIVDGFAHHALDKDIEVTVWPGTKQAVVMDTTAVKALKFDHPNFDLEFQPVAIDKLVAGQDAARRMAGIKP